MNCSPFVRQYGILGNKWKALFRQRRAEPHGFCGFAEHFAKSDATFREAAVTVLLTERFFHKLRRGSPAAPPFACQKGGIPVLSASGFLMPIPRKSFGQSRWGFQWIAASAFQAKGSLCFKWNFLDSCFLRSTGDLHYTRASASCRMGNPCFGSPAWCLTMH